MLISGAIGVSILKKNDDKIIIFSDNHASNNYCFKESLKISEFLEKKSKKHIVLLEEVPRKYREALNQIFFAEHTELLKELSINNKNIISVDIRPLLLNFSWELITVETKNKYNQSLEEYLKNLIKFLDYDLEYDELKDYFDEIKKSIKLFIDKNKSHLSTLLVDIVLKELVNLEPINQIVIDIMDFNIIRIILKKIKNPLNFNKHIYLHAGLYHTDNIIKRLNKLDFKEIYSYGTTNLSKTISLNVSCIKLHYDYSLPKKN
jgi:hypothetical protein